jgi:hypothetical protein
MALVVSSLIVAAVVAAVAIVDTLFPHRPELVLARVRARRPRR